MKNYLLILVFQLNIIFILSVYENCCRRHPFSLKSTCFHILVKNVDKEKKFEITYSIFDHDKACVHEFTTYFERTMENLILQV